MAKPTQKEVLEYARECRRQCPTITEAQLRAILRARSPDGRDPFAAVAAAGGLESCFVVGAVCNPFDWLVELPRVIAGILETLAGNHRGVEDIIEGVIRIVI